MIAYVALRRGEAQVAARSAEDALALRPGFPEARLLRAQALLRLARSAEAAQELRRFLDEAPPDLAAERARAEATLRQIPR